MPQAATKFGPWVVTESSSAPVTNNTTRWPEFALKVDALNALAQIPDQSPAIVDFIIQLSNTDVTNWTDKGSIAT